jgi:hypothetical protein
MAHTKDGVVIDSATGVVRLVIVPTHDEELLDPAFSRRATRCWRSRMTRRSIR